MITYGRRFGSTVTPVRRNDADQRVVDRTREPPAIDDRLVVEVQHRRQPGAVCSTAALPRSRSVSQNRIDRCATSVEY
jgi:hypothetical protein